MIVLFSLISFIFTDHGMFLFPTVANLETESRIERNRALGKTGN